MSLLLRVLESSLSPSLDPLPYGVALFLARAAHVMSSPANDLYVAVNTFLIRRPQIDVTAGMPLFYELFFSPR